VRRGAKLAGLIAENGPRVWGKCLLQPGELAEA